MSGIVRTAAGLQVEIRVRWATRRSPLEEEGGAGHCERGREQLVVRHHLVQEIIRAFDDYDGRSDRRTKPSAAPEGGERK